ncbi:MAG: ABC transporter permease [Pseudomonadota bacterium]
MRLIAELACKQILRERFFVICNIAVTVGILLPLLLLFGVKNGVYGALVQSLIDDPANLQIDTAGNVTLSEDAIAPLRDWPEVAFLTPKVRGQFDFMNVRAIDGRVIRPALVLPSGAGDPTLPDGLVLSDAGLAISAQLARQLELDPGSAFQLISQAEGRPRQLVLDAEVVAVLPDQAVQGRAVLAPFSLLDLIEAYYDSYALPAHGIAGPKDLADRVPVYSGIRVYARRLDDLAELQSRIESELSVKTTARTRDVSSVLRLGENLDLALALTSVLAALGLGGALIFGFWSDVAHKRRDLARIAMLGVPARSLALFPVLQALIAAVLGLLVSFLLYAVAGRFAGRLFGDGLPDGAAMTIMPLWQGFAISAAVLALVLGAAGLAAWSVLRLDPASVLREET